LPGALGWLTNPFLVWSVGLELVVLGGLLFIAPLASILQHAPPPALGWVVALLTIPAVLLADAYYKRLRRRSRPSTTCYSLGPWKEEAS
jgi:hypothetical protein